MSNLTQFELINKYYKEYFEIIKNYCNYKRHSLFCVYFNINQEYSVFENNTKANYSRAYHGVKFDVYEFTPILVFNDLQNSSQTNQQKTGLVFDGQTSLTTYTIQNPRINDILIFPYQKSEKNEIYRVKSINNSLQNVVHEFNFHYSLEIEYAPDIDIAKFDINQKYCYLLPESRYLPKDQYFQLLTNIQKTIDFIRNLEFDQVREIYKTTDRINFMIYQFIKKYHNFLPFTILIPFGYSSTFPEITPETIFDII